MTLDERLKHFIGNMTIQLHAVTAERDALVDRVKELEAKLPKDKPKKPASGDAKEAAGAAG